MKRHRIDANMPRKLCEQYENDEIRKKRYLLGTAFNITYFRISLLSFFKAKFMNIINPRLIQAMDPSSTVFCL